MQATLKLITACVLFLAIGTSASVIQPRASNATVQPANSLPVPDLTPMLIVDSALFPFVARIQIYAALSGSYTPQQEPCVDQYADKVIARLAEGGVQISTCIHVTGEAIRNYFLFHGAANITLEMSNCINGSIPTIDCYINTLCKFVTPNGQSIDSCVKNEPCVTDQVNAMRDFMDSAESDLEQCIAQN